MSLNTIVHHGLNNRWIQCARCGSADHLVPQANLYGVSMARAKRDVRWGGIRGRRDWLLMIEIARTMGSKILATARSKRKNWSAIPIR